MSLSVERLAILGEALAPSIPPDVQFICQELHAKGFKAWPVGGCIRDLLRAELALAKASSEQGKSLRPVDWDIACSATPDEVMSCFRRVVPTGIQHGTVTVMIKSVGYELTTLRSDGDYVDGRHPEAVQFIRNIEDDLARRDFTVNAIAYDPLSKRLIDPFCGISDLEQGILRAVGEAKRRFDEDGLRILRGARFAAQLNFKIETSTFTAMGESLASYRKVSAERVRDEWWKALKSSQPSIAFRLMDDCGLLQITDPQASQASRAEVLQKHAYARLDHFAGAPITALSAWLSVEELSIDAAKKRGQELGRILKLAKKEQEQICRNLECYAALRNFNLPVAQLCCDEKLRALLIPYDSEALEFALLMLDYECGEELKRAALITQLRHERSEGLPRSGKELQLSGAKLISELGLEPGQRLGELLNQLLLWANAEPGRNEPELLLNEARRLSA